MSPIDIVPLESNHYDDRFMDETSVDVYSNHVYTNASEDAHNHYASGTSTNALIRQPPQPGRPAPQVGKQVQVRVRGS